MSAIIPTVGRMVHYRLSTFDVAEIMRRRSDAIRTGVKIHEGNDAKVGDVYPAVIVKVWSEEPTPESAVNLQVFLDGTDTFWASSRVVGEHDGNYQWMAYQKGQAAKTEELQAKLAQAATAGG